MGVSAELGSTRIIVIGCTGAGKSVFSSEMGRITGLPGYHLDSLFWRESSVETDRDEWRRIQEEIAAEPAWIIEGNYGATIDVRLGKCDTVIFLDYRPVHLPPRPLRRIFISKLRIEQRPDVVAGCNERLDRKLISDAWTFSRKHRKGILKGIAQYPHVRLIALKKRSDARRFLRRLSLQGGARRSGNQD